MRKSVQKALANQRAQARQAIAERRAVSPSASKGTRKLRKQIIEDDFGNLPIR